MTKVAKLQKNLMAGEVRLGGGLFLSVEESFPALVLRRRVPNGMRDRVLPSGFPFTCDTWQDLVLETEEIFVRNHLQVS